VENDQVIKDDDLEQKARVFGGVPVWGSIRGSAADQLGLRGGDILLRINGVRLQSAKELSRGRWGLSQTLELDVLRAESLVRIVVPLEAPIPDWIEELRQQVFGRASC
jgi:S1-C subfamily serine protease